MTWTRRRACGSRWRARRTGFEPRAGDQSARRRGRARAGANRTRTARTQTQKRQQTLRDAEGVSEPTISAGGGRVVSRGRLRLRSALERSGGGDFGGGGAAALFGRERHRAGRGAVPAQAPSADTVGAHGPRSRGGGPARGRVGAEKGDRGPGISNASNPDEGSTEDASKRRFFFTSARRRAACGASTATRRACSSAAPAPGGLCTQWRGTLAPRASARRSARPAR